MIDDKFIKEHTLLECLQAFEGAAPGNSVKEREESLTEPFSLLAKKLLFGGRFKVGEYFDIVIETVEFYYHEENDYKQVHKILDPIVYHKNSEDRKVPPFPIMTLNTHQSGIDIAFEDPDGRYRASALIREFFVIDHYDDKQKARTDSRSLYIYDYLNGFSIDGNANYIHWEPEKVFSPRPIYVGHRKNVFTPEYKSWVKQKKKRVNPDKTNEQRLEELDSRLWAFSKSQTLVRHSNGATETYQ